MNDAKDERIVLEQYIIDSIALKVMIGFLLFSIIVQQFFMRAEFKQFAGELFALIVATSYKTYGNVSKGINLEKHGSIKGMITSSLLTSLCSMAFLFLLAGMHDVAALIKFFVAMAVSIFGIKFGINYFTKQKQKEIDKLFEDD